SFSLSALAAQLLAPVDAHFDRGAFGTYAGVGPIPSQDTALRTPRKLTSVLNAQVSQPLTQLHRIKLGVRMRDTITASSREALRAEQPSVIAQVKQSYYQLLQTQSALDANEEALQFDRELERVVA